MLWRILRLPFTLLLALSKRVLLALFLATLVLAFSAVVSDSVFATLSGMADQVMPGGTVQDRQASILAAERARADGEGRRADAAVAASNDLKERNATLLQNNDALNATNTALKQQGDTLTQANAALTAENKALKAAAAKAQVTYQGRTIATEEAVAEAARKVADRIVAAAKRTVAAAPGEAVPFYGIPLVAAMAAQHLSDDCANLRDLHGLDVAFNPQTALDDQGTCELGAPDADKLWQQVQGDETSVWQGLESIFANLPVLLLPPWWTQAMQQGGMLITPMPAVTVKP